MSRYRTKEEREQTVAEIKRMQKEEGLSIYLAAKRLGVNKTTIYKWMSENKSDIAEPEATKRKYTRSVPTLIPMPASVQTKQVVAFYGSIEDVAALVRSLQ